MTTQAARYSVLSRSGVGFETTPTNISPAIEAMCAEIGAAAPVFVEVEPGPRARAGWCFANVEEAMAKLGGSREHGWVLWESAAWLNGEFHAVHRLPDGRLVDPTPKPDGERRILYASDPRYPADFDFFRRPNNRRMRTYQGRAVADRVADLVASYPEPVLAAQRRRAAKAGTTLESYVASRLPPDRLERRIDAFLACACEAETLLVPGPSGMTSIDDRRLVDLELCKLELAERIEREWASRPAAFAPAPRPDAPAAEDDVTPAGFGGGLA
jgi:hypothetical protein